MTEDRRLFGTVLVANRGEIARRVIRTLRGLGIRSVAVYSDADAGALHVREADVAYRIGPAEASRSYLDIDAVLQAARRSGAEAIHPGYGFLSENAAFARACERAGIVFVGPPASAIEAMGDKVSAKRLVAEHGVPVTAGVDDRTLDDDALAAAAERLGMPVLVKPSAGGGGMGMVEVREASVLPDALRTARRVAKAAFGDDALFVERLVERPRHIEVQVLADAHGSAVHLGERECTLQRRHQKVIEEAPSPAVDDALRARLGEAACAVARSVGYTGVGTVEFLVPADDPASFSFMEMNTRLQVEHPVTELVAGVGASHGIDLVEQQLRVAAGEALSFRQEDVRFTGHAVEARVYAEDPDRGFLPATGRVRALHEAVGEGIRIDGMLTSGLEITDDYDPMLCKVIAFGTDRDQAFERLSRALRETCVLGVTTNVSFLVDLVDDPQVRAGRLDTGLIERTLKTADAAGPRASGSAAVADSAGSHAATEALLAAALLVHDDRWRTGSDAPWSRPTGWRLGAPAPVRYAFADRDGAVTTIAVDGAPSHVRLAVLGGSDEPDDPGRPGRLLERGGDRMLVQLDARALAFRAVRDGDDVWMFRDGTTRLFRLLPSARSAAERGTAAGTAQAGSDPRLRSPMPGTVVSIDVADGDRVEAGTGILVIEAMKMEHRLAAPGAGIVRLAAAVGDRVAADQELALIDPDPTKEGRP
ncbi:acetyl/propionyl/methylcrotonyl-CoA carboxylase subunit alpha [Humibacter albus]|uniref:acetyl/propionyl/methylcrotonyl-CoA carboxylase subunit alpha n=1 Tax=Humibacter albus TaxID=427754 RepID=UPI00040683D3|nr:biotin carboxylase N-terminal domain-containing protein [Humibacter albus]